MPIAETRRALGRSRRRSGSWSSSTCPAIVAGPGDDASSTCSSTNGDAAVPGGAARRCRRTIAASTGSTATSRAASSASPATCARPPARPTASTSSPPRRRGRTARSIPETFVIDELRCIYCGMCEEACPVRRHRADHAVRPDRPEPRGDDVRQGEAAERLRPDGERPAPTRSARSAGRLSVASEPTAVTSSRAGRATSAERR